MDVGEVHLNDWHTEQLDAVAQGDGRMRVSTSIQNDAVKFGIVGCLKCIDEEPFYVALEVLKFNLSGIAETEAFEALLHSESAIDGGLASAQSVEVGTIYDIEFHKEV
jgi:hypothetical protein